jgi:uncharacterized protein (TIGR02145 family)
MKNIYFVLVILSGLCQILYPSSTKAQSWSCGLSYTDKRDNTVYNTVLIGNQCWFQQNLNYGTKIPGTTQQTNNSLVEKYCYNNVDANCSTYGGLYQWGELVQYVNGSSNTASMNKLPSSVQGLCPDGWLIPSDPDWCTLATYVDNSVNCNTTGTTGSTAGGDLKEIGYNHWLSPNTGATNGSFFTGLPGGVRLTNGSFAGLTTQGGFWSWTEYSSTSGFGWGLGYNISRITRSNSDKTIGFSVRCFRNCTKPNAPTPGTIIEGSTLINWNWNSSQGASGYKINTTNDYASATDLGSNTSYDETGLTCNTSYTRYVWAYTDCNYSDVTILSGTTGATFQQAPIEGFHIATTTDITWKWKMAFGATGYKWNTTDDLPTAIDLGLNLSNEEPDLTANTLYTRYVWAVNGNCGISTPTLLTQKTKTNTFLCGQTIIDPRDGGTGLNYNTVLIGNQCWLKQNLNVGVIADQNGQLNDATIEKFCYNNIPLNCDIYGGLYTWDEMMQYTTTQGTQGICPNGWYLPSDNDWCTLTTYLDNAHNCGDQASNVANFMKEVGTTHWSITNNDVNDNSIFSALPGGGFIYPTPTYDNIGEIADFWTSTQGSGNNADGRQMYYNQSYVGNSSVNKSSFLAVRCMKDCTPPSAPVEGTHVPTGVQITWNWGVVTDAIGYRWNYTNDYNSATEILTNSYTEVGLIGNTTYTRYIWAFKDGSYSSQTTLHATTSPGTTCPTTLTDIRDGQTYPVVQIGPQCWMAKNLNYSYGNVMTDQSIEQSDDYGQVEKYCYNNSPGNCDIYGGLYQWAEAVNYYNGVTNTTSWGTQPTKVRGICPLGWHIPLQDEWGALINYLGGEVPTNNLLKQTGNLQNDPSSTWNPPSNGTDYYGFKMLGGGEVGGLTNSWTGLHQFGFAWTATEATAASAYLSNASNGDPGFFGDVNATPKDFGGSVRCIMDDIPENDPIVDAGPDQTYCPGGNPVSITPTVSNGSGNYTYSWTSFPAGFTSSSANITVSPNETTIYQLQVTDNVTNYTNYDQTTVNYEYWPVTFDPPLNDWFESATASIFMNGSGSIAYCSNTYSGVVNIGNQIAINDNNNGIKIFVAAFDKFGKLFWANSFSSYTYGDLATTVERPCFVSMTEDNTTFFVTGPLDHLNDLHQSYPSNPGHWFLFIQKIKSDGTKSNNMFQCTNGDIKPSSMVYLNGHIFITGYCSNTTLLGNSTIYAGNFLLDVDAITLWAIRAINIPSYGEYPLMVIEKNQSFPNGEIFIDDYGYFYLYNLSTFTLDNSSAVTINFWPTSFTCDNTDNFYVACDSWWGETIKLHYNGNYSLSQVGNSYPNYEFPSLAALPDAYGIGSVIQTSSMMAPPNNVDAIYKLNLESSTEVLWGSYPEQGNAKVVAVNPSRSIGVYADAALIDLFDVNNGNTGCLTTLKPVHTGLNPPRDNNVNQKYDLDNEILIYPNPNSGTFQCKKGNKIGNIEFLQIFDSFGKQVYRLDHVPVGNEFEVTLPDVTNGIYFIHFQTTTKSVGKKINLLR